MLGDLLQIVPQHVLPPVSAGQALVQSLQVHVFSLQVTELGLYGLPLRYDDLQQGLKIGGTEALLSGRGLGWRSINKNVLVG